MIKNKKFIISLFVAAIFSEKAVAVFGWGDKKESKIERTRRERVEKEIARECLDNTNNLIKAHNAVLVLQKNQYALIHPISLIIDIPEEKQELFAVFLTKPNLAKLKLIDNTKPCIENSEEIMDLTGYSKYFGENFVFDKFYGIYSSDRKKLVSIQFSLMTNRITLKDIGCKLGDQCMFRINFSGKEFREEKIELYSRNLEKHLIVLPFASKPESQVSLFSEVFLALANMFGLGANICA
jgi:predicted metal-binding transcription factor (methanogenesis marker protein 9)